LPTSAIALAAPLAYEGIDGPGKGKHIVFIANDHDRWRCSHHKQLPPCLTSKSTLMFYQKLYFVACHKPGILELPGGSSSKK